MAFCEKKALVGAKKKKIKKKREKQLGEGKALLVQPPCWKNAGNCSQKRKKHRNISSRATKAHPEVQKRERDGGGAGKKVF